MHKSTVTVLAMIPVVLLLIGGMRGLHPLVDSLAVFRLPLGMLSILSGAVLWPLWPRKWVIMLLALGGASSVTIAVSMVAPVAIGKARYVFYQKNLSFRNSDLRPLAKDIQQRQPDFITLQEVTSHHKTLLNSIVESHPSQHYCNFASVGGVAVASKYPAITGTQFCVEQNGLAAMQVVTPDGPVWLISIHFRWPYPYNQAKQAQALVPVLKALKGPVFLGGDFNMVPWANSVTTIEQATGSHRVGHTNGTFRLSGVFNMPIDHILIPLQFTGTVESLDLLGSDHRGVEARIVAQKMP